MWLLRLVNSGQLTIGKFHEHMNQLIVRVKGMEEVDGLDACMNTELKRFFNTVWHFVHNPMHVAGFV